MLKSWLLGPQPNIKADPESGQADGYAASYIPPIKCLLLVDTANQLSCLAAQNHALFRISNVGTPAHETHRIGFTYRIIGSKNQTVRSYDLDQGAQHAWIKKAGVIVNVSKVLT